MKAWSVTHPGEDLEQVDLPEPALGETDVRLDVTHCGVCHSDVHFWEGELDFGGPRKLTLADMGIAMPMTLGHEIVGRVVEVGPAVKDVAIGETRLVYPWLGCGECELCLRGDDNLCTVSQALGIRRPGGFGTQVVVPHPRYLLPIDGIDPGLAATYACSGLTAFSAIRKLGALPPEDPVLIIGVGGVGLSCVAILKALGHRRIIAADLDADRLAAARTAGASETVIAGAEDAVAQAKAAAGKPIGAVIDFVNSPKSFDLAFNAVASNGKLVMVGLFGGSYPLPLMAMAMRKLTLMGSFVGSLNELRELLEIARSGNLPPIPIELRPKSAATCSLEDLRGGRITGRVVLCDGDTASA